MHIDCNIGVLWSQILQNMFMQFIGASHTVLVSSAIKQTLSSQTINICRG